jgi:hypothetical protein
MTCHHQSMTEEAAKTYAVYFDVHEIPPTWEVCPIYHEDLADTLSAPSGEGADVKNLERMIQFRGCDTEKCEYDQTSNYYAKYVEFRKKRHCVEADVTFSEDAGVTITRLDHDRSLSCRIDDVALVTIAPTQVLCGVNEAEVEVVPVESSVTTNAFHLTTKIKNVAQDCTLRVPSVRGCSFSTTYIPSGDTVVHYMCEYDTQVTIVDKVVMLKASTYLARAMHFVDTYHNMATSYMTHGKGGVTGFFRNAMKGAKDALKVIHPWENVAIVGTSFFAGAMVFGPYGAILGAGMSAVFLLLI